MYSEYGTAFDGKSEWNLGNGFARNVLIFGVDNSSSSHTDIRKNKFLILNEGPTYGINKRFSLLEKNCGQFAVNLDRCVGSCNTLDDLSSRVGVSNETEDLNLHVFNMITRISTNQEH